MPDCKIGIAQACELGDWTPWTPCDRPCGSGVRFKEREIVAYPAYNGGVCEDPLQLVEPCNTMPCTTHTDCIVSDWTMWTPCSASCGGGQKHRERYISQPAFNGGKPCSVGASASLALVETTACAAMCCADGRGAPQDCVWGEWGEWGACSHSCDGGERQRQREILASPKNGGKPCDSADVMNLEPCNQLVCGAVMVRVDVDESLLQFQRYFEM
jgi:hypothetical protein